MYVCRQVGSYNICMHVLYKIHQVLRHVLHILITSHTSLVHAFTGLQDGLGTRLLTHALAVAIRNKVSFTICTIVIVVQQYSVSGGIWVHVHVHSEKADECMLSGPHTIIIFI